MSSTTLFYATNRNHEGNNQWTPTGYGKYFSSDGHENLRFGKLTTQYNENKVEKFINKDFGNNRIGDGEGLSDYFTKKAKQADIYAYKDDTPHKQVEIEANSSTQFFLELKENMMRNSDVVIYIHGYSVSWEAAVGGAQALEFMLNSQRKKGDKKVMVVLFSWPSNGSNMPFAAYKSDRSDARDSGKAIGRALLKLKDFLGTLHTEARNGREQLCKQEMHLVCHSMGNYILQNALTSKVIGYTRGATLPRMFKNIFLCAADVNDEVLEGNNPMSRLHEMSTNVSVYYNHGDLALNISKYSKHLAERLGHIGNAHPALVHNKIHQIDCSPIVKGIVEHSYYLWATVNKDIWQSINGLPFDDSDRNRKQNSQSREWTMT